MEADHGKAPASPRSPGSVDGRLRARLEASCVGLEELSLLRQIHLRAIQGVKSMLMSNVPEDEQGQEEGCSALEEQDSPGGAPPARPREMSPGLIDKRDKGGHHVTNEVLTYCRKRASSMDMSASRSLALTAKKLRGPVVQPPATLSVEKEQDDLHKASPATRTRSASFSADAYNSVKQTKQGLKKGQSLSVLPGHKGSKQHPLGVDQIDSSITEDNTIRNSLSGSFLCVESPNSPRYNKSLTDTIEASLTETDFDSHFTSARSLSGSKLKYEFPSPMHAILLHYDKREHPILEDETSSKSTDESKMKTRRASFSGPIGRRSSRQELVYKLRKDSSLGELPVNGSYCNPPSQTARSVAKDKINDDGVSAFIEMLSNRGLAKKRQEEQERKQRMIEALDGAKASALDDVSLGKELSNNENHVPKCKKDDVSGGEIDQAKADHSASENSHSADRDSGQWEGSNLSSSGKCGSHISLRSSASSKGSLSSEEGYYSHPGSPQNQHSNNRFSILSASSLASGGSLSFYQSECSDEDILESPIAKLQDSMTPEASESSKTLMPSSSDSLEIIPLQNSPGAKRRYSASALVDLKHEKPGKSEKYLTLPKHTSTPLGNMGARSLSQQRLAFEQSHASVTLRIRKGKPSSPINIESKQNATSHSSRDLSSPPKVSFQKPFDTFLSPTSGKDSHNSSVVTKDPSSRGKLLQGAARPASLSLHSTNEEIQPSGCNRSRFECPKTPTIKEEPTKEAELTENLGQSPPALSPLSLSPARDNVAMLSPTIGKAPKVPSWRKQNKGETKTNENNPDISQRPMVCQDMTGPKIKTTETEISKNEYEPKQMQKDVIEVDQKPKVVFHSAHQKSKEKKRKSNSNERLALSEKTQTDHSKQKLNTPSITITMAADQDKEKKDDTESSKRKPKLEQSPKYKGTSSIKVQLQPTPGREYISRTPKSDTTNVFQYPSVTKGSLSISPKNPSQKDIQEMLRNWVEARTPTLPPENTDNHSNEKESKSSRTLPRGYKTSERLPSPLVKFATKDIDTLRRSKRMFHSQELYPKHSDLGNGKTKVSLTAAEKSKQTQLNQALNESKDVNGNISKQSKNGDTNGLVLSKEKSHELQMQGSTVPSTLPQPRPRSQTWSRGQQPQTVDQNRKNTWVRETVVPPSTPTSTLEARIYRTQSMKSKNCEKKIEFSHAQLKWSQTCKEIKDTFV